MHAIEYLLIPLLLSLSPKVGDDYLEYLSELDKKLRSVLIAVGLSEVPSDASHSFSHG